MNKVEVLDTSLRDGCQSVDVSFTPKDKVELALALDDLGVAYIEGGWPGSNPKDSQFFKDIKEYRLSNSKVAAFGSTRKKNSKPKDDASLNSIIGSGVSVGVLFGKSWTLHVEKVLNATKEENLDIIGSSVSYLMDHGISVLFDAEHFYQGYQEDRQYALEVLKTANNAGAETLILCDTNGGTTPNQVSDITKDVLEHLKTKIGLHMHNDTGCAVANTLMGVAAGATHIQGTINGIGERSGNADLVQVIPALSLKMNCSVLKGQDDLKKLKVLSERVYEMIGRAPNPIQPFVGENVFAHKAGVHADAVMKDPRTYEHINPEIVGNARKIIVSEVSGSSTLVNYAGRLNIKLEKTDPRVKKALDEIKLMEKGGYSFDLAPESALLVLFKELGLYKEYIKLDHWKTVSEKGKDVAEIKVNSISETGEGDGPVNAIDNALRKATKKVYPELSDVQLTNYHVVLPGRIRSTASIVRVTIEFTSKGEVWRTMGVSPNIIEASVKGLVDGLNYYLCVRRNPDLVKGIK